MRVLSQNGLQTSIGMSLSGGIGGEQRIATLLTKLEEKGIKINDLAACIKSPILFVPPHGGNPAYGFEATILADLFFSSIRPLSGRFFSFQALFSAQLRPLPVQR